jgi:hypothetical protein
VVNVDPDRAEREVEPLATLTAFRNLDRGVRFGMNLVHDLPVGAQIVLTEGDAVHLE